MSAGDEPIGEAPAGEETVVTLPTTPAARPAAIFFDGTARDFPLDADGRYTAIHPVDSRVQIALMVEFGRFGSSPATGNTIASIGYLDPLRLRSEVADRVRLALKRLIDAGDITIESIDHDVYPQSGALFVAVSYFNERLPDRPRKTITTR